MKIRTKRNENSKKFWITFRDESNEKNQTGKNSTYFRRKIIGFQIHFQAEDENVGSEIEAVRMIELASMHKEYVDLKSNAIYSIFNVITSDGT